MTHDELEQFLLSFEASQLRRDEENRLVIKNNQEDLKIKEESKVQSTVEEQKGFMGWITNSLSPKLDKLTQNVYIMAIQQSIMSILPMIMIGSVSSIVGVFRRFEILSWIPDISQLNTFF